MPLLSTAQLKPSPAAIGIVTSFAFTELPTVEVPEALDDPPAWVAPPLLVVPPVSALPPMLVLFPEDELLPQAMSPKEEISDIDTMNECFNLEFMATRDNTPSRSVAYIKIAVT